MAQHLGRDAAQALGVALAAALSDGAGDMPLDSLGEQIAARPEAALDHALSSAGLLPHAPLGLLGVGLATTGGTVRLIADALVSLVIQPEVKAPAVVSPLVLVDRHALPTGRTGA